MANLPKLEELTQNQLQMLQEACSSFFPVEILGEGYKGSEVTEFSIAELGLNWKSRENFLVDILRITDQKDIRSANKILDKYAGEAPKEAERPEGQTQTTPANREELEQERLTRETSEKQAWARAKEDIERSKQRLEEIQVEKDKKLHVKVTSKEEVKFTEDEQKVYENYKDYSKQKPQQAVEELSQEIENRVGEDLKAQGFTDEEIKVAATGTATQLVENFTQSDDPNYVPQTYHTAILAHVAQNSQLAGSQVSESAKNVATDHLLQYQMYKDITKSAFGKYFADENFGIDADKLDVSFSEAPQAGGMTFTPYEVVRSNQSILEERSQTLDTVREFGVDRAKGILLNKAGSAIEQRIALLTPNSAAGKLLQSVEAKSLLFSTFGVGAPIKWEATNLIGRLALKSGYAPVVSAFGKLTGINTGLVGSISTGVAKQTLGKVAAKTGIKAAISTTLASVGISIPVPILNFIAAAVGWLVGEVFGKLIEKYGPQIKKFFKEVLGPLLLVGGGFLLGVPALGLAAGGLAFGVARGLTLAGIGAGIWNFFRTLGGAFAMTIATPIIVTLLVLPPLVAFIMLVINSGAYIVPPVPAGGSIIHIPPGGNLTRCDPNTTGEDITNRLASSMQSGTVYLLPDSLTSRQEGICMDPTMIVLHTSGGYDNDDGNTRTYETLVQNDLSCQMATDTNETILMLSFFERQVEYSWCADDLNNGGVSIEMAGECQGNDCAPVSKCSPSTDLTYTPNGPHPCDPLEDMAFSAICKVMQEYKIPWTQVFQHEASNGSHTDPVGDEWADKFIIRLKDNCVVDMN